jgi:quinol monooxygenase YgiN
LLGTVWQLPSVAGTTPALSGGVVISTLRLIPAPERRRETIEVLRSVQGPTQAQPDCLDCRIYEEENSGRAILYYERWQTEAGLHQHVRSDLYRRLLATLELSSRPPEIRFDSVAASAGMELIEGLRASPAPRYFPTQGSENSPPPIPRPPL